MPYLQGPFTVNDGLLVLSQLDEGLRAYKQKTGSYWKSKKDKQLMWPQNTVISGVALLGYLKYHSLSKGTYLLYN